jgi:hypothetical protein
MRATFIPKPVKNTDGLKDSKNLPDTAIRA